MPGRAPAFWWRPPGWEAALLAPLAAAYGAAAARRLAAGPRAGVPVPVLCVGNFVAGGGGKTPAALALAEAARGAGHRPGFLSRGHGGRPEGARRVDPAAMSAHEVGDEPLLLAARAPTAVAVDRAAGAALLLSGGDVDFLVMDDGFQSQRLGIDCALLVVDGARGLGNGRVLPAGPLRARLPDQMARADALLLVGEGPAGEAALRQMEPDGRPVLRASLQPRDPAHLAGRRVLAFAGIADPAKFYRTLRGVGAEVVRTADFPDHHPFTAAEVEALGRAAERDGLTLATTRKDFVRLGALGPAAAPRVATVAVLDVDLVFAEPAMAETCLAIARAGFARRRAGA